MKNIFLISMLFFGTIANADLTDRVQLEDSLRSRIEDVLKIYDHNIRAMIRIDYKNFEGTLPGTNIDSKDSFTPVKVESSDVAKVNVEIYTTKKELDPEVQELVYRIIPFEKSKVAVQIRTINSIMTQELSKNLDSESLANIMNKFMDGIKFWLLVITFGGILATLAFSFFMNQKQISEFKSQMVAVTKALSDNSMGGSAASSWSEAAQNNSKENISEDVEDSISHMSLLSLKELIADCYWCRQDSYASWIWKKINNEQRRELLTQLPFMKDYSHFIVDMKASAEPYHDHPYYLEPMVVCEISQEDLSESIKENTSLWHSVSPMRQNSLPLALEVKLMAVQSKPTKSKISMTKKSPYRELSQNSSMGELSLNDEKALFENPDLVPIAFKQQVKSLVWLALQPEAKIESILSRYDARSLASAWIGPDEILSKLEKTIPEKKLKILQTYKTKMVPSRSSAAYLKLVSEGWREDAA